MRKYTIKAPKSQGYFTSWQDYLVLRNRFTYVKDSCLWMPEFKCNTRNGFGLFPDQIRDSALFPNKFGHPDVNYWNTK